MKKEQIKQELINRYSYIFENSEYILAPFMYEQTKKERDKLNKEYRKIDKNHPFISDELSIYLEKLPHDLLLDLESFLLSDIPYNESKLYIELEEKKKDKEFLLKVKNGVTLLEKKNSDTFYFQEKLDSWKLLTELRKFIDEQSGDLKNKNNKLLALDEYFKINRYSNDGNIWSSGYYLKIKEMGRYSNFSAVMDKRNLVRKPSRDKDDIGLKRGDFIKFLSNKANLYEDNESVLTEEEKQNIYLKYHDALAWDLRIICEHDDYLDNDIFDRPNNTKPCKEVFYVKEDEIFINPGYFTHRYYQLCPHCGYIVNIPNELLSEGVKRRIEERCSKDPNLFRKMYLYSELFSLDKSSTKNQRKLLKK